MPFEMKRTRPVRTMLDQHRLDPECPECGAKVPTTVGEARQSPTRRCPNGHEFTVDASKFDRIAKDVQRQVDDLLG
jgi:hypothetical protein